MEVASLLVTFNIHYRLQVLSGYGAHELQFRQGEENKTYSFIRRCVQFSYPFVVYNSGKLIDIKKRFTCC